jgi:hypothetical protein
VLQGYLYFVTHIVKKNTLYIDFEDAESGEDKAGHGVTS